MEANSSTYLPQKKDSLATFFPLCGPVCFAFMSLFNMAETETGSFTSGSFRTGYRSDKDDSSHSDSFRWAAYPFGNRGCRSCLLYTSGIEKIATGHYVRIKEEEEKFYLYKDKTFPPPPLSLHNDR